jgi:hypothetical protein
MVVAIPRWEFSPTSEIEGDVNHHIRCALREAFKLLSDLNLDHVVIALHALWTHGTCLGGRRPMVAVVDPRAPFKENLSLRG